jgi:hypothetical protein|tara:strand:+ start:1713 stop:2012 length:300 start_codon:yes stop_codon:yes gene_type:complete
MQRLVSPDLKQVYTISDQEALSELVAGLCLDSTIANNFQQLLGFKTVGNDGRQGHQMAENWPRLHSVRSAPAQTCARSSQGEQCDPDISNAAVQTPDAR